MTESELSGEGMAPNSPTPPSGPAQCQAHSRSSHAQRNGILFQLLCLQPQRASTGPEHPPLPALLCFSISFPPLLCAEPGGGRAAAASPGVHPPVGTGKEGKMKPLQS